MSGAPSVAVVCDPAVTPCTQKLKAVMVPVSVAADEFAAIVTAFGDRCYACGCPRTPDQLHAVTITVPAGWKPPATKIGRKPR